jgi:hypothetical protein
MSSSNRSIRTGVILVALTSLAALSGCSKGPQERLQGKWVGETIDNIPPEQEARATGWVKHTSFEFRGEKVTVGLPAGESRTGTYKIERATGNRLTLQVDRGSGEPDSTTLTFVGENAIKWDIGNERTVKFTRVAQAQ